MASPVIAAPSSPKGPQPAPPRPILIPSSLRTTIQASRRPSNPLPIPRLSSSSSSSLRRVVSEASLDSPSSPSPPASAPASNKSSVNLNVSLQMPRASSSSKTRLGGGFASLLTSSSSPAPQPAGPSSPTSRSNSSRNGSRFVSPSRSVKTAPSSFSSLFSPQKPQPQPQHAPSSSSAHLLSLPSIMLHTVSSVDDLFVSGTLLRTPRGESNSQESSQSRAPTRAFNPPASARSRSTPRLQSSSLSSINSPPLCAPSATGGYQSPLLQPCVPTPQQLASLPPVSRLPGLMKPFQDGYSTLSQSYVSYLAGPILFTAPHGLKIYRGGFGAEPLRVHSRERYITEITLKLASSVSRHLGFDASFMVWNLKTALEKDPSNIDPNYCTSDLCQVSPWSQNVSQFAKMHRGKRPILHFDLHGKRDRQTNLDMDLGMKALDLHWGKELPLKRFTADGNSPPIIQSPSVLIPPPPPPPPSSSCLSESSPLSSSSNSPQPSSMELEAEAADEVEGEVDCCGGGQAVAVGVEEPPPALEANSKDNDEEQEPRAKKSTKLVQELRDYMCLEFRRAFIGTQKFRGMGFAPQPKPELCGYWPDEKQIYTMTQQSVMMHGVPAIQLELPLSLRREMMRDSGLLERFAAVIAGAYRHVIASEAWFPRQEETGHGVVPLDPRWMQGQIHGLTEPMLRDLHIIDKLAADKPI